MQIWSNGLNKRRNHPIFITGRKKRRFSGQYAKGHRTILIPGHREVIGSGPGFSTDTLNPESIKILTWNVYKEKRKAWAEDFKKLSAGKHIIMIQEARLKYGSSDPFTIKGMGLKFARSFSYNTPVRTDTGVMTISVSKPRHVSYIRTATGEPLTHTPKISLIAVYRLENADKNLMTINTHAINFVKTSVFMSQMSELEKTISSHAGPVIFAGDFNTWNKKRNTIISGIITRLEMKETDFNPDTRTKRFRYPLDHIFYKGLELKNSSVAGSLFSSDHKALEAEFYLPGRGIR